MNRKSLITQTVIVSLLTVVISLLIAAGLTTYENRKKPQVVAATPTREMPPEFIGPIKRDADYITESIDYILASYKELDVSYRKLEDRHYKESDRMMGIIYSLLARSGETTIIVPIEPIPKGKVIMLSEKNGQYVLTISDWKPVSFGIDIGQ